MDESSAPIFTQAKMEYTSQLIYYLTPQLFDGIKSIYDEAITMNRVNKSQSLLSLFRSYLEKVPSWSNEIIENETDRIIQLSKCDWLDDLLTAVFISHTKILTAIGSSNDNSNIDLVIPKTINFIHKCYINVAREIWKNPYLYDENILGSEYQKNMRTVEDIIKVSIENTIRKLLPVKEILKKHLDTYETNNQEIQKRNETSDIKKMLRDEINNLDIITLLKENNKVTKVDEEEVKEEEIEVEEPVQEHIPEKEQVVESNIGGIVEEEKPITYTSNDGYVSPDEDEIKKKCENITINTINEEEINNTEQVYDNANIVEDVSSPKKYSENDLINTFIESLSDNTKSETITSKIVEEPKVVVEEPKVVVEEPKVVVEEPKVVVEEPKVVVEEPKIVEEPKVVVEEPKDVKAVGINEGDKTKTKKEKNTPFTVVKKVDEEKVEDKEETKEGVVNKEIISVDKFEGSDCGTVDEFFKDMSDIMEKKGVKVDRGSKKYTLFDDAINEE